SLNLQDDSEVNAVLKFLRNSTQDSLGSSEYAKEIVESSPFMAFRLNTDTDLVCQRKAVIDCLQQPIIDNQERSEFCLVSGQEDVQATLQPAIKGVRGTNTTGGNIVSFNLTAFNSFGKKQGANAPMGEKASFAYTTALNHLLGKDSTQKLQVGDATLVFWSDRQNHSEDDFRDWFDEPDKDNPDRLTEKVRALLKAVDSGVLPPDDNETKFFILGLSPNAARISIRFWHVGTVTEFSHKIAQHFHDLEIIHSSKQRDHLSIWWLLRSIAPLGKTENISPNLAGDWMRTILNGNAYPETLFQSAIRRIHTERNVSYERTTIIKACLNRKNRYQTQHKKEMKVSLDKENTNPGYRIGRLFAVLEKIQEESSPGINATIRDRYYSSASGTPASVFPILLRMKNHHLGKLVKGREVYFEKLLGEVMEEIISTGFPAQLSLQDQGRFAIGYYHQRQAMFTKSDKTESSNTDQGE
ncbi:MAG: type I-C CRISPR-associated protein Cas8c/Csd1, partial [Candidatus Thiodiazotropha sp. (ex Lucinoma kastoroae)]|nr:type I-C CRISPR-associated protein Cas8c/Csd1 [Candidatus Thiodiazotropha sp. (ex Lucinoma kastoroae)]